MAFGISTYSVEFLRLALWLGTISAINLFWIVLRVLGYEITRENLDIIVQQCK